MVQKPAQRGMEIKHMKEMGRITKGTRRVNERWKDRRESKPTGIFEDLMAENPP